MPWDEDFDLWQRANPTSEQLREDEGMTMGVFGDSGFVGVGRQGQPGPQIDAPRDWMIWHFTPVANLRSIVRSGRLVSDDDVGEHSSVANDSVKALRREKLVAAHGYPGGRFVSAHVPFYIAAKSPMLYVVWKKYTQEQIVFLGARLGDVIDAGLDWVASDGNAAAGITQFTTQVDGLGYFIDFELMTQRQWDNTALEPDRKRKRAAEVLVHHSVPLTLLSEVVAKNEATLEVARRAFESVGMMHLNYVVTDALFY